MRPSVMDDAEHLGCRVPVDMQEHRHGYNTPT